MDLGVETGIMCQSWQQSNIGINLWWILDEYHQKFRTCDWGMKSMKHWRLNIYKMEFTLTHQFSYWSLKMPASCKKNTAHIIPDNDCETIDINVSSSNSQAVSVDGLRESQPAPTVFLSTTVDTPVVVPIAANNAPLAITSTAGNEPGMLALILPSVPITRTNHAHDINFFFTCGSKTEGTSTICNTCQSVYLFLFTYFIASLISIYNLEPSRLITQLWTILCLNSLPIPATPLCESISQGTTKMNILPTVLQIVERTNSLETQFLYLELQWTPTGKLSQMMHSCRRLSTGLSLMIRYYINPFLKLAFTNTHTVHQIHWKHWALSTPPSLAWWFGRWRHSKMRQIPRCNHCSMEEIFSFPETGPQSSCALCLYVALINIAAKGAVGKISYMMDIWSSENRTPYMAVTAHWMANKNGHLKLKCALIAFQRVWGKHTTKNLARILLGVLDHAGTTTDVSSLFIILFSQLSYSILQDGACNHGQSWDKHQGHGRVG